MYDFAGVQAEPVANIALNVAKQLLPVVSLFCSFLPAILSSSAALLSIRSSKRITHRQEFEFPSPIWIQLELYIQFSQHVIKSVWAPLQGKPLVCWGSDIHSFFMLSLAWPQVLNVHLQPRGFMCTSSSLVSYKKKPYHEHHKLMLLQIKVQ